MTCTLIADDNSMTAAFISRILKKQGHAVTLVNNAIDAWRMMDGGSFDVVLANVAMPGLDSLSLAKKALLANPSAQVVFVTGFAATAISRSGRPARPFHIRDLARKLVALWRDDVREAAPEQKNGTVIYPDFSARKKKSS